MEGAGFTRGCPDFAFTVLTYAAVSLLKIVPFDLAPLSGHSYKYVVSLARKAADVLARAAVTPDHLPASQSILLTRLISSRMSTVPPTTDGLSTTSLQHLGDSGASEMTKAGQASGTFDAKVWPIMSSSLVANHPNDITGIFSPQTSFIAPDRLDFTNWYNSGQIYPESNENQSSTFEPFQDYQATEYTHDSIW